MCRYHANDKNDDVYFSSHHTLWNISLWSSCPQNQKNAVDKESIVFGLSTPIPHISQAKAESTNSIHDLKCHDDILQSS